VFKAIRAMGHDVVVGVRLDAAMEEDTAIIAGQLAELTRTVESMAVQLKALGERADNERERADKQQERSEVQQERIDLAARELAEVSDRLQAAANALRESV
jgi:molecular chaperone GrpE (heat shock protein)